MNWYTRPESWSFILRRYLPRLTLCSLAWEIAQLPLYTLWQEPRLGNLVYAVAHCTVGDAMIGTAALALALTLSRAGERATWPGARIVLLMVFLAVAYTLPSERINLARGNWAYSAWMPVLPWIKVGLAPVLQWVAVPFAAWGWANRKHRLIPFPVKKADNSVTNGERGGPWQDWRVEANIWMRQSHKRRMRRR